MAVALAAQRGFGNDFVVYSMRQEADSEEEEVSSDEGESDDTDLPYELGTGLDLILLERPAVSDPIWNATLRAHALANIDMFVQEILRRPSSQRVLDILTSRYNQRVSDVPWYAAARRRAVIARDRHAARRARIQREWDEERERERPRDECQIQQEQQEERQPYIDELLATIDSSFAIDTDFLSLSSTFPMEARNPSPREHSSPSNTEQGRSQRSGGPEPDDREMMEDRTAAQRHERGPSEGNERMDRLLSIFRAFHPRWSG